MEQFHEIVDRRGLQIFLMDNEITLEIKNIKYKKNSEVRWSSGLCPCHWIRPSRVRISTQNVLRGGRTLCEYCTNKLIKLGPGWLQVRRKTFQYICQRCRSRPEPGFLEGAGAAFFVRLLFLLLLYCKTLLFLREPKVPLPLIVF